MSADCNKLFLPFEERPILLLFSDDSTLFFVRRMRECLMQTNHKIEIHTGWVVSENALSYRQMEQLLPEGPEYVIHEGNNFNKLLLEKRYSAIITSRVYLDLDNELKKPQISVAAERPCVLGFLGGLDFYPEKGFKNRRNCDGVYIFPRDQIPLFSTMKRRWEPGMWQEVDFGHPTFLTPTMLENDTLSQRRDIYFFTQALSPVTERSRRYMLRALCAIARANPDRTVWIKLRHLPDENQKHLHFEEYAYTKLLASMHSIPENLKVTACTMDEALETAALGITCTSTAVIDLIRSGIPCMAHLDFIDHYIDPLVEPMRQLMAGSNIITSLEDMLNLRANSPNADWVANMFCDHDLGGRVLNTISRFNRRPFQANIN